MVRFDTRIFNEDDGKIIGAEITVYSDTGDKLDTISIADAETLEEMQQALAVIDETYFTEERLLGILANSSETETINATLLSGFQSSDFAKVSQLSAYAPASHTHVKTAITNLYNYSIRASNYNVDIDNDVTITVKVTNQAGSPVVGETVQVYKNNVAWQSGTTGTNGEFSLTYNASEWGLTTFSAHNSNIQINVKGFRTIIDTNGYFMRETTDTWILCIDSERGPKKISCGTTPTTFITLPSQVTMPWMPLVSLGFNNSNLKWIVSNSNTEKNVLVKTLSGTVSNVNDYVYFEWTKNQSF